MNSLELFNQIYTNENERSYSISLLDFFKAEVKKRLPNDPRILDIGAGTKSLFEEELGPDLKNITAIDFSPVAILKAQGHSKINYLQIDITTPESIARDYYDLVFDSHCLHCITNKDSRESAFKNIYNSLKVEAIAAFEMMVSPSEGAVFFPGKHVPSVRDLEQEILAHGFKIIYFMIVRNLVFENKSQRCELLRVIVRK